MAIRSGFSSQFLQSYRLTMRRRSVLYPYVRAAAFHLDPGDDVTRRANIEFAKSALAYFAASDFHLLRFLLKAHESVQKQAAETDAETGRNQPTPGIGDSVSGAADRSAESEAYTGIPSV